MLFSHFQTYPELYSLVGSKVPNYRGLFLRGQGGNAAALGVLQEDAIRNLTGYLGVTEFVKPNVYAGWKTQNFYPSGVFANLIRMGQTYPTGNDNINTAFLSETILDASRQVPTASENRPINKDVRYLIRAKS